MIELTLSRMAEILSGELVGEDKMISSLFTGHTMDTQTCATVTNILQLCLLFCYLQPKIERIYFIFELDFVK